MPTRQQCLTWAAAVLLVAGLLPSGAQAQDELDLSSASDYMWKVKDMGGPSEDLAPAAKDFTATEADGWSEVETPLNLNPDWVGENTTFWMRLEGLKLPASWPKDRYLVLKGFNIDDNDNTFFNGTLIGSSTGAATVRTYIIPPELLDPSGTNVIAIKGENAGTAAGMTTTAPTLTLVPADSGMVRITAKRASDNKPLKNVLVTITDPADGVEKDRLTEANGEILIADVPPGPFPVEVNSYSWVGTVTPQGKLTVNVSGGKVSNLALTVTPFVYTVLKAATPIKIDGDITGPEWDGAMAMDVRLKRQATVGPENWDGEDDCSVVAKWKWDDTYIYMAADVTDDVRVNERVQNPNDGDMWQGDGFETYIQLDPYLSSRSGYAKGKNFQWTLGVNQDDQISWKIFRSAPAANNLNTLPPDIPEPTGNAIAVTKKSGKPGYILEARFPWASLPEVDAALIPPKEGTEGAIGLAVNDTDTEGSTSRETQVSWNTRNDLWSNASAFTRAIWAGTSVVPPEQKVWGDGNADGKFTITDAIVALRAIAGLPVPDTTKKDLMDVDGKAGLSITDVLFMLRRVANLIPKFPVEG